MKNKSFLLGLAMLLSMGSAFAQWGGTLGPLSWKRSGDTLYISGVGDMPDFSMGSGGNNAPWNGYPVPPVKTITHVNIANGVTRIGDCAFVDHMGLLSIDIPNSVNSIGSHVFYCCSSLPTVTIPNSVTRIEKYTFILCRNLASITLPADITNIEDFAFEWCTSLTSFTNYNPVPIEIKRNVFYEVDISACTLYVPMASVSAYQNAPVWKEFKIEGVEVSIDEQHLSIGGGNQLLIYPNPASGACNITIPNEFLYENSLTLSVYDASGKLVQQIEIDNDSPEKVQLKLDHKAQGVYVATLSNGGRQYTGKVVFITK